MRNANRSALYSTILYQYTPDSTCAFYFILLWFLKALSCRPFPSVTNQVCPYSDLHKMDTQWSPVPCSDVLSRSALLKGCGIHCWGKKIERSNIFHGFQTPLILVHFYTYVFWLTPPNRRTLSHTSKTARTLWAETQSRAMLAVT